MSGLQGSDINDKDIIDNTTMLSEGPDAFKFTYTLPSGALIESNTFTTEGRRKAILGWLSAVRSAVVDDIEEAAAKARRGKVPPLEEIADAGTGSSVPSTTVAAAPVGAIISPEALIKAQYEAADAALVAADKEYTAALEKKTAAEAAVRQWSVLMDALTASAAPPAPSDTVADTSPATVEGSAGKGRRRRSRVPQQTPSTQSSWLPQSAEAG